MEDNQEVTIGVYSIMGQCVYVKRMANMVAHRLAKLTTSDIIDKLWDFRILECISDVI